MTIYRDVSESSMFSMEIMWCYHAGLLQGWPDGTFRPLQLVNRDAAAAVMHRLAGQPHIPPGAGTFTDVASGQQFAAEIEWVHSRGLLTGWPDGTFRPVSPMLREACCVMFYRAAGSPAYTAPATSPLSDINTDYQFYREVCWAWSQGIITGYQDGTVQPISAVKRDAMAAFLYRFDQVTG